MLQIRKLPDWVVEAYRVQAEASGRSLEEELRLLLTGAAPRSQCEFAAKAAAFRERLQFKYGVLGDSTDGIREERERRG